MENIKISAGKTPRNELRLPNLHFIVVDDWFKKIDRKTFCFWLELVTLCDRSDKNRENDIVPQSISKLAANMGMSRNTLMKHIKTLWNYGFIDLEEYEESKIQGQKPVNIIVYSAPRNSGKLLMEPLEKIRDYDKDYHSKARKFASRKTVIALERKKAKENNPVQKNEQGPVQKNEQDPVQKFEQNNVLNISSNSLNTINNYLSIIKDMKLNETVESMLVNNQKRLTEDSIKQIKRLYDSYAVIDMNRFILKLGRALSAGKDIPAYLQTILNNPDKPGNQQGTAAVRVEEMPEGLKNSPQGEELTPEQLAEAEKIREKYRKARAAQ